MRETERKNDLIGCYLRFPLPHSNNTTSDNIRLGRCSKHYHAFLGCHIIITGVGFADTQYSYKTLLANLLKNKKKPASCLIKPQNNLFQFINKLLIKLFEIVLDKIMELFQKHSKYVFIYIYSFFSLSYISKYSFMSFYIAI